MSRPRNNKAVEKVMQLRSANPSISFREIAKILNKDVRIIYNWYKMGTGDNPK